MLYRVKLSSIVVDSSSKQGAYLAALSRIRSTPDAFIIGVYDEQTDHSKMPLWKRLVTGK